MAQAAARKERIDRFKAAGCAAFFQLVIGYAFVSGLNLETVTRAADALKVFTVPAELPPPPVEDVPPPPPGDKPEGEGSPPDLKAEPTPVIAPPPEIPLHIPPPVTAAPIVSPVGNDPDLGASTIPGPGVGRGGVGNGPGTGMGGSGEGGAKPAVKARRLRGALRDSDYPAAAAEVRAGGTVFIRFTVRTDGRVEQCSVTRSSGFQVLDETTCRLVERRFRYRPARDAAGQPVPEVVTTNFTWGSRIS